MSVPMDTTERMQIGWIANSRVQQSQAAELYLAELRDVLAEYQKKA